MTARACVIGWPIGHSRSPLIHGHWLGRHEIDGSYTKHEVTPEDLEEFLTKMPEQGFVGANVTVPHKEQALALADHADEAARAIGAANTLWFEDGKIHASNTDAYGFLRNLDQEAPGWDQSSGSALVLGAGGAARAVLFGLLTRGFDDIRLANRTRERADELASHFGGGIAVVDWEARNDHVEGCALIVNTTSLGMTGAPPLDLDLANAGSCTVVTDLVYVPLETPLLAQARARGLRVVDGLGMLLHQAEPGFERWFGVRPEVTDDLRQLIIDDLSET
ncbi:MAG: shikimate dehydrogenase [Hyphomicrobiaceae bacterium]|nr:shikimate dehydrogenase [Hyphomicrobiaceae bacterium]